MYFNHGTPHPSLSGPHPRVEEEEPAVGGFTPYLLPLLFWDGEASVPRGEAAAAQGRVRRAWPPAPPGPAREPQLTVPIG